MAKLFMGGLSISTTCDPPTRPNSLPRDARISCVCIQIVNGFALRLLVGKFVCRIGGLSPAICGFSCYTKQSAVLTTGVPRRVAAAGYGVIHIIIIICRRAPINNADTPPVTEVNDTMHNAFESSTADRGDSAQHGAITATDPARRTPTPPSRPPPPSCFPSFFLRVRRQKSSF